MNPRVIKITCFLCLLVVISCVDVIPFDTEEPDQVVVIEGIISNSDKDQYIKVGYLNEFGININRPISGAVVKVYDDTGKEEVCQESNTPGQYVLKGTLVKGEIGKAYYIEVQIGNKTYRSTSETMQPNPEPDSIYFEVETENFIQPNGTVNKNRFVNVYVGTPLIKTEEGLRLRWATDVLYTISEPYRPWEPLFIPKICYISEPINPQNIHLLDASELEATRADGIHLVRKAIDNTFEERHYFNVYQYSLTKNAFEFWENIDAVSNRVGNIFDPPPAPIRGNIYNIDNESEEVLGYFSAASVDTIRVFTVRQYIDYRLPKKCGFNVSLWGDECWNCLTWPNATLERPYWY